MRFLKAAIVLGLIAAPSPLFATTSADIEAKGNSPAFCNISNDGGTIKMDVSSDFGKLSGQGKYNYVANGNSKVVLSAVSLIAPKGAEAATPSLELVDLVVNTSSTGDASSKPSAGAVRQGGVYRSCDYAGQCKGSSDNWRLRSQRNRNLHLPLISCALICCYLQFCGLGRRWPRPLFLPNETTALGLALCG